ncbi:Histidine ammonia-lyase [Halotydeus destructor]|nr:Histidine ammonia-lyase [Halotydeus destructor]
MKVSVRIRGEWFAIPCSTPQKSTILWLGQEALRKLEKLRPSAKSSPGPDNQVIVKEIRKTRGGAILDPDDIIGNILDNNDYVTVVLQSDQVSAASVPVQINYVPEHTQEHPKATCSLKDILYLDGHTLDTEEFINLGHGCTAIKLTAEAEEKVKEGRDLLEHLLNEDRIVYGINTGFGKFANTIIDKKDLEALQVNLIRSHAAGVGNPLTPERVRRLLALRINVLAKGYSGISIETLNQLIDAFNASCLPWVPEKGTVGASGDLAPLAHLALGMLGEGRMWSPESGWGEARYVLESHNLKPIKPKPKEGLALLNGTQLITSLGAEAVEKAVSIARQADVVAALTLEVLKGSTRAFDSDVHRIRPHHGQTMVAKRLRSLLHSDIHPSEIAESHRFCNRVQDAYTLRCCPQVHGISHDTISFVRDIIVTEMNSATDNPLVFAERSEIISGGNFHGEYPAKALDYLAIGVHELASMSERRTERLINPALSGLPAFLVENGGLNSGFMLAHCTAAALVSENKVLCHPATVDSLPTSAGTEDHVSMGGFAARKALDVVENVEKVVAIELLAACQAIEFLRPLKTTEPLEHVYRLVRSVAKAWDTDRFMAPDIDAVTKLLQEQKIWHAVEPFIVSYSESKNEIRPSSPTTSYSKSHYKKRKLSQMDSNGNLAFKI